VLSEAQNLRSFTLLGSFNRPTSSHPSVLLCYQFGTTWAFK